MICTAEHYFVNSYHTNSSILFDLPNPACAGLASGAIMTGIALGTNSRFFPEEGPETLRLQSLSVWKKMLRGAFGYATFFTTFEGLRRGIYKSRLHDTSARGTPLPDRSRDLPWHATNFISGFTAGFAYRCALIPWTQSSGERTPIPLRQHSVIVVRSAAKMGILGLSIGVAEVFLNLDFTTGVWSLEA